MRKLSQALQRQLRLNQGKNLLHPEIGKLLEIDGVFLAALEEMLSTSVALSSEKLDIIAADAVAAFVGRIHALNQYIQIDGRAKESLKRIYTNSWHKLMETKEIESTIRNYHYPKITAFVEAIYPLPLARELQTATELRRVPSSEYSAELQTELLRLDPLKLREPILDIGCGSRAYLVQFLRSKNLEAHGIDRFILEKADYLIETSWFDYDYGRAKWGTIVSNLSFANHLVYAERYDAPMVSRYLKTFSKILDSLNHKGTLTFAPAVELLEKHVDETKYRIDKWEIPPLAKALRITAIAS